VVLFWCFLEVEVEVKAFMRWTLVDVLRSTCEPNPNRVSPTLILRTSIKQMHLYLVATCIGIYSHSAIIDPELHSRLLFVSVAHIRSLTKETFWRSQ
jgi:hypothetical protein